MYNYLEVIKFNNEYFEDGEVVTVTKDDGSIIVGSIMIGDKYGGSITDNSSLALDTSEKYHQKRKFIHKNEITNIQKVN